MTPVKQSLETATPENITLETFHNITVRKIIQNGRGMIPVLDITNATSLDRGNISRLLKRNEKFFREYQGVVRITTPGGVQSLTCLTRDGIMGLLFKVDAARAKDETKQDLIIEFQHWATEILGKHKVGQDVQIPQSKQATLDCINHYLDIADIAVARSNVSKDVAHKQAWALAAEETTVDIVQSLASLVVVQSKQEKALQLPEHTPEDMIAFESHFSKSQIANFVGKSDIRVRDDLEKMGIIKVVNGKIHTTKYGEDNGFVKLFWIMPMSPYDTTQRPHVRYSPKAREALQQWYREEEREEKCHLK
jgi:hypothetical protein